MRLVFRFFGFLFAFFYVGVLVWQTYYAICTSRTAKWGTRGSAAPAAIVA